MGPWSCGQSFWIRGEAGGGPATALGPPLRVRGIPRIAPIAAGSDCVVLHCRVCLYVLRYLPDARLTPMRTLDGVNAFAMSPSARWLARTQEGRLSEVIVEDVIAGKDAETLSLRTRVGRTTVDDARTRLAVHLSDGRRVCVLDLDSGRLVSEFEQPDRLELRFLEGHQLLVALSGRGAARIWSTPPGAPLGPGIEAGSGLPHPCPALFAFEPGPACALVRDFAGGIHAWDVSWLRGAHASTRWTERILEAQLTAGRRILEDGRLDPLTPDAWRRVRAVSSR